MNATQTPQFTCSTFEFNLIQKIASRALALAASQGQRFDFTALLMDLEACHCTGNPLNLSALLASDDGNFAHDVFGIMRHIDRKTGELGDCFSPRCSMPATATLQ